MNQEEVWKKIEGYPKYEVSNRGNVRNIKFGKMLRGGIEGKGYLKVILLTEDQQRISFSVHSLVAQYFIDNPNGYEYVGHIDRNTLNNNVENLRWETKQQNCMKKRKQKQITSSIYKGVTISRAKWQASIQVNKKPKYLGLFESELEAAKAYDEAAKIYFKEFARLNFEDEGKYNEYIRDDNDNDNKCEKQKISIYRGVSFNKQLQKWVANIWINKRNIQLGYYDTELEAAKVYDEAAKREFKEMAVLNLKEDESNKIEIKQKPKIEKSSIYRGVTFHNQAQKWQAQIWINKKNKNLGLFESEIEAARAYDKAAKELHKQFAKLNFKDEKELTEQLANLNINEDKQE